MMTTIRLSIRSSCFIRTSKVLALTVLLSTLVLGGCGETDDEEFTASEAGAITSDCITLPQNLSFKYKFGDQIFNTRYSTQPFSSQNDLVNSWVFLDAQGKVFQKLLFRANGAEFGELGFITTTTVGIFENGISWPLSRLTVNTANSATQNFSYANASGQNGSTPKTSITTYLGRETVTTSNGLIFNNTCKIRVNNLDAFDQDATYWIAPGVGFVKGSYSTKQGQTLPFEIVSNPAVTPAN